MTKIVWEEKWHEYPDVPVLGDYIQVRVEHMVTKQTHVVEGTVSEIDSNSMAITPDPLNDEWYWDKWRRGALPEHRSVERREAVDA